MPVSGHHSRSYSYPPCYVLCRAGNRVASPSAEEIDEDPFAHFIDGEEEDEAYVTLAALSKAPASPPEPSTIKKLHKFRRKNDGSPSDHVAVNDGAGVRALNERPKHALWQDAVSDLSDSSGSSPQASPDLEKIKPERAAKQRVKKKVRFAEEVGEPDRSERTTSWRSLVGNCLRWSRRKRKLSETSVLWDLLTGRSARRGPS